MQNGRSLPQKAHPLAREAPRERIYLDWNATAPLRAEAREAMRPFLERDFGNAASVHRHGQEAQAALERARAGCANVLGCAPEELVFTSGGTESDNLALRGLAWAARGPLSPGRVPEGPAAGTCRIVCSEIEHSAVRETVRALGEQGFETVFVPAQADGVVNMPVLLAALFQEQPAKQTGPAEPGAAPRTAVVALMYANNETGVVQPVAEAARACRERAREAGGRVLLHVDAVQAPGKLPLQVNELGCDTLALSSHKFEGPKGAGLLYVRKGTRLVSHLSGGRHEQGLRGGTPNVAGAAGMAEALRLAEAERAATCAHLAALQERFERFVREKIPAVVIHGLGVPRIPNTSFVSFLGLEAESLVISLDLEGLSVSTGAACTQGSGLPSHVLAGMGLPAEVVRAAVRFSWGRLTTEAQLQEALERLMAHIAKRRELGH